MSLTRVQESIAGIAAESSRDPDDILLLAVSKGQPIEKILELYAEGIRDFGENRVQEVLEKKLLLPSDIRWHLIGTLQTKKVGKVVGAIQCIHSVDSLYLAEKISQVSQERKVISDILLQVNMSNEPQKHGMSAEVLLEQFGKFLKLSHLRIKGLMTMAAPYTKGNLAEELMVRASFANLRKLKEALIAAYPEIAPTFTELSIGMSQDYQIAIQEGSTCLRIGSLLFS